MSSNETDKNVSNQHTTTMDTSSSGCESKAVKCRTATEEVTDIDLNCSVTVTKERTLDHDVTDTDPNCSVTAMEERTLDQEVMDTGLNCNVTVKDKADGEELDGESNDRNVLVIVEEGDDEEK